VLACLRTSSPYIEFYEELLTSDLGVIGVDEDKQGGDQVEVHYLEGGGDQSKPGIVRIDLETIYKLDSQLVRDQVRELFSRTFGGSKLPDVIISTLTTLMGPGVGVNNSRSAGFCLKINSRVENLRLIKKVERTFLNLSGEVGRSQSSRGADGGSEREPRRATQDFQGDQGDPSDGQKNPQATFEAGEREVQNKLLGVVNNATEAIETAHQDQNRRSSNVARGFGLGGISWPHIFTALFGAGSSTLPCSAKDLERVLIAFDERIPLIKDAAQAKIAIAQPAPFDLSLLLQRDLKWFFQLSC